MVPMAWPPSRAALYIRHEHALLQFGSHPDMTLDVSRMYNHNNKQSKHCLKFLLPVQIGPMEL